MKKIFLFLFLLILGACQSSPLVPDEVIADPSDNWDHFEDEELGMSFQHPSDLVLRVGREITDIDLGHKRSVIGYPLFEIHMSSFDFGAGIDEGCCYVYSGSPIDLSLSLEELEELLDEQFLEVYNLEKVELTQGGSALRFDKVDVYADRWVRPALLIPHGHSVYTNILITGPTYLRTEDDAELMREKIQEGLPSPERMDEFELFLNSLKVLHI